ncbi:esterase/lipase family protein [Luteipulveratus halotolerans]|uniref:Triacylglycerol lipase n=1 Tax=Luteipulveratus halotolerans TaxID=1631356 RepID=A0A0L6CEZ4_9MICO|nr:alpha/beta fold hydrolase [Luteipulveratus halotolerans]KNX36145.1 triacylglycerol lipase [Luteipulveratus halotolerans]
MPKRGILVSAVLTGATALVAAMPQSASAAEDPVGPVQLGFLAAKAYATAVPTAVAPGMNDWSCKPSAAHPRPVVLVHGTWANRYDSFALISPELKKAGYCVYGLNYGDENDSVLGKIPGVYATAAIKPSGGEIAAFVDKVTASTGSKQVDMVGWSQGGIAARSYLQFYGGADPSNPANNKVKNLITYGATHHGTTLSGLATLAQKIGILDSTPPVLGQAAVDQTIDSPFQQELNANGDTVPGVSYTVIGTKYDEVTTPYTRTFLTAGPGATVKNITLQDGCAIDFSDHLSIIYSWRTIGLTKKALDPSANVFVPCLPNAPVL